MDCPCTVSSMRILIVLCALLFATAANADTLPRELQGHWCLNIEYGSSFYKRGNCGDSDGHLIIKRNSLSGHELFCQFNDPVVRYGSSFPLGQKPERFKVYEVKAKCGGESDSWYANLFFQGNGSFLEFDIFLNNELPREYLDKTFCKTSDKLYIENNCDRGITITFEKDRYTIRETGSEVGFCRYVGVTTVWDSEVVTATKSAGGFVTHVLAQCRATQKIMAIWTTKVL